MKKDIFKKVNPDGSAPAAKGGFMAKMLSAIKNTTTKKSSLPLSPFQKKKSSLTKSLLNGNMADKNHSIAGRITLENKAISKADIVAEITGRDKKFIKTNAPVSNPEQEVKESKTTQDASLKVPPIESTYTPALSKMDNKTDAIDKSLDKPEETELRPANVNDIVTLRTIEEPAKTAEPVKKTIDEPILPLFKPPISLPTTLDEQAPPPKKEISTLALPVKSTLIDNSTLQNALKTVQLPEKPDVEDPPLWKSTLQSNPSVQPEQESKVGSIQLEDTVEEFIPLSINNCTSVLPSTSATPSNETTEKGVSSLDKNEPVSMPSPPSQVLSLPSVSTLEKPVSFEPTTVTKKDKLATESDKVVDPVKPAALVVVETVSSVKSPTETKSVESTEATKPIETIKQVESTKPPIEPVNKPIAALKLAELANPISPGADSEDDLPLDALVIKDADKKREPKLEFGTSPTEKCQPISPMAASSSTTVVMPVEAPLTTSSNNMSPVMSVPTAPSLHSAPVPPVAANPLDLVFGPGDGTDDLFSGETSEFTPDIAEIFGSSTTAPATQEPTSVVPNPLPLPGSIIQPTVPANDSLDDIFNDIEAATKTPTIVPPTANPEMFPYSTSFTSPGVTNAFGGQYPWGQGCVDLTQPMPFPMFPNQQMNPMFQNPIQNMTNPSMIIKSEPINNISQTQSVQSKPIVQSSQNATPVLAAELLKKPVASVESTPSPPKKIRRKSSASKVTPLSQTSSVSKSTLPIPPTNTDVSDSRRKSLPQNSSLAELLKCTSAPKPTIPTTPNQTRDHVSALLNSAGPSTASSSNPLTPNFQMLIQRILKQQAQKPATQKEIQQQAQMILKNTNFTKNQLSDLASLGNLTRSIQTPMMAPVSTPSPSATPTQTSLSSPLSSLLQGGSDGLSKVLQNRKLYGGLDLLFNTNKEASIIKPETKPELKPMATNSAVELLKKIRSIRESAQKEEISNNAVKAAATAIAAASSAKRERRASTNDSKDFKKIGKGVDLGTKIVHSPNVSEVTTLETPSGKLILTPSKTKGNQAGKKRKLPELQPGKRTPQSPKRVRNSSRSPVRAAMQINVSGKKRKLPKEAWRGRLPLLKLSRQNSKWSIQDYIFKTNVPDSELDCTNIIEKAVKRRERRQSGKTGSNPSQSVTVTAIGGAPACQVTPSQQTPPPLRRAPSDCHPATAIKQLPLLSPAPHTPGSNVLSPPPPLTPGGSTPTGPSITPTLATPNTTPQSVESNIAPNEANLKAVTSANPALKIKIKLSKNNNPPLSTASSAAVRNTPRKAKREVKYTQDQWWDEDTL